MQLLTARTAEQTNVVYVAPVDRRGSRVKTFKVVRRLYGRCEPGSDVLTVPVFRCLSGTGVYDPCWVVSDASAPNKVVWCLLQPWSRDVYRIVTRGLPAPGGSYKKPSLDFPWGIQLTTGQRCLAVQGTRDSYRGQAIDFYCTFPSKRLLGVLRGVDRHYPVWTYRTTWVKSGRYTPGPTVKLRTAWYGWP